MNVVKCSNNVEPHFFDGDKYEACPHCGAAPLGSNSKNVKSDKEGRKNSKTASQKVSTAPIPSHAVGDTFGIFNKKNFIKEDWPKSDIGEIKKNNISVVEDTSSDDVEHQSTDIGVDELEVSKHRYEGFMQDCMVIEKEVEPQCNSVQTVSVQTNTSNSGKTQGFFSIKQTMATASNTVSNSFDCCEPCAGWLVCIKGIHFGRNFSIYAGKNSIGREYSNRIAIPEDVSVSREKHAWIMYEPRKRDFYVMPGEGSGLVYLNDENVMTTEKLSPYDKIEIGDGTYMFIPLCGENFTWEDYMG